MKNGKFETVNEAKEAIRAAVKHAFVTTGVFGAETCPTGEAFGWDMMKHYALEWFQRNPPEGWNISSIYRHECYEWAITEK